MIYHTTLKVDVGGVREVITQWWQEAILVRTLNS